HPGAVEPGDRDALLRQHDALPRALHARALYRERDPDRHRPGALGPGHAAAVAAAAGVHRPDLILAIPVAPASAGVLRLLPHHPARPRRVGGTARGAVP